MQESIVVAKKQWHKPVVVKLDVGMTRGGARPSCSENEYFDQFDSEHSSCG